MLNTEFLEKMDKLVEKAPENRHSYYQLKYFVIGKQPTTQSQLWQCLTELQSRKETMESITMQMEDSKDELQILDLQELKDNEIEKGIRHVSKEIEEIFKKEKDIKIKRLKRKKESINRNIIKLEKQLDFVTQEARFFVQAFEALEKVEPLKDFDDYEAQKELWEAKVSEEVNLRLLFHQPLSSDTLKTALSLHDDSRIKQEVFKMIGNLEKANVKMIEDNKLKILDKPKLVNKLMEKV
jgi:hypothetical protein